MCEIFYEGMPVGLDCRLESTAVSGLGRESRGPVSVFRRRFQLPFFSLQKMFHSPGAERRDKDKKKWKENPLGQTQENFFSFFSLVLFLHWKFKCIRLYTNIFGIMCARDVRKCTYYGISPIAKMIGLCTSDKK